MYLVFKKIKSVISRLSDIRRRLLDAKARENCIYWTNISELTFNEDSFDLLEKMLSEGIESAELWRIKGEKLIQLEQYAEANLCFDRALRLHPRDPYLLNYKGFCLDKLGHYEIALSCFQQAVCFLPRDPEILTNTGICLCHLERYSEALNYFERALKSGGGSPALWNNKGFCLAKLGRHMEAYAAYKIALEQGQCETVELLCNMAATLVNLGFYREAMDYFDKALRLNPEDPLLLNNVAVCLEQQGRYDIALRCYEKALANDPGNIAYLCNKGICLSKMKRWDEALECLEEVVRRDATSSVAYGEIAAIYLAKGQVDKALFYYNMALGLRAEPERERTICA